MSEEASDPKPATADLLPPKVLNRNGPGATHGLRVTYNRGCRCRPCRFAMKDDVARITSRKRTAA